MKHLSGVFKHFFVSPLIELSNKKLREWNNVHFIPFPTTPQSLLSHNHRLNDMQWCNKKIVKQLRQKAMCNNRFLLQTRSIRNRESKGSLLTFLI